MSRNRIKDLREDRDLRQADVARATGIDQRTLSNYETGKTNPDSFALIKLADFFDVSIDYLVGRTDLKNYSATEIVRELKAAQKLLDDATKALLCESDTPRANKQNSNSLRNSTPTSHLLR